jgi:hypothetical protein
LTCAKVPIPSTRPKVPDPAIVVTIPSVEIFRIRDPDKSVTTNIPAVKSIPNENVIDADVPVPSTDEESALPTKVVTASEDVSARRIRV